MPPKPGREAPHFRVSPAVLLPLGVEQLQDPALAVLELLKNSWDADATKVKVEIESRDRAGSIRVSDNGHGMSASDFSDRWLVIGVSHKRRSGTTEGGRPLIGEKGLGRLATFALGKVLTVTSARSVGQGFTAKIDWDELSRSASLEEYGVPIESWRGEPGTCVEISQMTRNWDREQTDFLVTHAEFLTAVPGEAFRVRIVVDGKRYPVASPRETVSRLSEANIEMEVQSDGTPHITRCDVNGDRTGITFREMAPGQLDRSLAGARLAVQFFRRDEAVRKLRDSLQANLVSGLLDRYQGVRIYRDGINVPPYGLQGDDWAGLERQRTATGGPTMVPGNSQLVGELHLSKERHPQFVITAGRSGFADQHAISSLANYVRWTVKELGTARRAALRNISSGDVPNRVDDEKQDGKASVESQIRSTIGRVIHSRVARREPEVRRLADLSAELLKAFGKSEETLRLYAQLASTGIAATSFVHELRGEFDVITDALAELSHGRRKPDQELLDLLNGSWSRIRAFVALFQVIPVKLRRRPRVLSFAELRKSATAVLGLAPPEKIKSEVVGDSPAVRLVPAELDSVLLNLVSNAVKAINASRNSESGRLLVNFRGSDGVLEVRVADNGCGVTPRVARVMFEPLEGQFSEGTGMGLPIVQFIAERYGGFVQLVDKPPAGYTTEFRVILRNVGPR